MAEETKTTVEQSEAPENEVANEKTETQSAKKEKKSKKDNEVEKLRTELDKQNDILLRTAAEFDNFKKRTERERVSIAEYAKAGVAKQLLPIIDNIGRASGADKESPDYIKGIEMIVKQFEGIVDTLGLTKLANVGDNFDPNIHEAVMHIEDENLGENIIAEVLQQGYKIGDTVVRPAMVKVAN